MNCRSPPQRGLQRAGAWAKFKPNPRLARALYTGRFWWMLATGFGNALVPGWRVHQHWVCIAAPGTGDARATSAFHKLSFTLLSPCTISQTFSSLQALKMKVGGEGRGEKKDEVCWYSLHESHWSPKSWMRQTPQERGWDFKEDSVLCFTMMRHF